LRWQRLYSLFVTKYWQVTGKIVIVPSGNSATAGQNLYLEAGNTAEMMNSPSFKGNILGSDAKDYDHTELSSNSSTITVIFLAGEADIKPAEDVISGLPEKIASHARDLYGGSPFKYILVSDPQVSQSPVKPDVIRNVGWGFGIGFLLYFLFWLFSEAFGMPRGSSDFPDEIAVKKESAETLISPVIVPEKKVFKMSEAETSAVTKKEEAPEPIITSRDMQNVAPSNLPIAESDQEKTVVSTGETGEPSDAEVKERLNKLMRGEL
jgi:hypothetical protein